MARLFRLFREYRLFLLCMVSWYVPPIVFGGKTIGGYGYAAIQHCQREINKKHPFSKFAERVLFARLYEIRCLVLCIYFCEIDWQPAKAYVF